MARCARRERRPWVGKDALGLATLVLASTTLTGANAVLIHHPCDYEFDVETNTTEPIFFFLGLDKTASSSIQDVFHKHIHDEYVEKRGGEGCDFAPSNPPTLLAASDYLRRRSCLLNTPDVCPPAAGSSSSCGPCTATSTVIEQLRLSRSVLVPLSLRQQHPNPHTRILCAACEKLKPRPCYYITIVRGPIGRLVSAYNYFCLNCEEGGRECGREYPEILTCPDMTIREYGSAFKNLYTRAFAAHNSYAGLDYNATEADLAEAKRWIDEVKPVVLFTEDMSVPQPLYAVGEILNRNAVRNLPRLPHSNPTSHDKLLRPTPDLIKSLEDDYLDLDARLFEWLRTDYVQPDIADMIKPSKSSSSSSSKPAATLPTFRDYWGAPAATTTAQPPKNATATTLTTTTTTTTTTTMISSARHSRLTENPYLSMPGPKPMK